MALALLGCILLPGTVTAAPAPSSTAPTTDAHNPLVIKQQIVRDRMIQLEDRMYRLIEQLSSREPDQARRLDTALKRARELLIRRNMDETIRLLDEQDLAGASDRQLEVIRDLENVLKVLLEDPESSRQRREEIARLEAYLEQVRKLYEAQQKLQAKAEAARAQRDLGKQTDQLARQMSGQAAESQPARPPAPGSDNVQRGADQMGKAADQLDQKKAEQASENQKGAAEELRQAMESLQQAIDQLRQEQREQVLRELQTRLQAMLDKHTNVSKSTEGLDKKGQPAWTHADELAVTGLATDELDLADQASELLRIIKAEGQSIVFPELLQQARNDLEAAAQRLQKKDTGNRTQAIQAAASVTLSELIESLKQIRSESQQSGGGGSGGGSGGNPPLVPPVAELKLLRSCQQRLNERTVAVQKSMEKNPGGTTDQQAELSRLAEQQGHLGDLARKIHELWTQK